MSKKEIYYWISWQTSTEKFTFSMLNLFHQYFLIKSEVNKNKIKLEKLEVSNLEFSELDSVYFTIVRFYFLIHNTLSVLINNV